MQKAAAIDDKGEPLYAPPQDVAPVSAVRGSVLVLDWLWLRENNHFERYSTALGLARGLLEVTPQEWVPFPQGMAHWRAIEALGLTEQQEFELGKFNAERKHHQVLLTLMRLAGSVGVTPWLALTQCHKLWLRAWDGGGMAVYRIGEHIARVELINNPLFKHRQFRNGMRGAVAAGITPFCKSPVVQEITAERTPSTIVVRASWKP
jgi:hypothetical protein